MAVELGTAYLTILPSTRGFGPALNKQIGGDLAKAGGSGGKEYGGFFSRAASTAAGIGLAKAGAAVGGLFSAAVGKGMGRLEAIDTARGKLTGLGKDAGEVDAIMASALASVKGTAFGLGDAAAVAASTVAAGVKPGADLERTLKLVGDAATIGGTSMNDMGAIFNKVAASNKIQMGEMNQLMDRGIPVQQMLADHLGVSTDEVQRLASAGQIGFADFQAAMEKGLGGAALASGETFRGALDNVGAAIGRLGAAFLEPTFKQLPAVFGSVITVLDGLTPAAQRAGEMLGTAFGASIETAQRMVPVVQDVWSTLTKGQSTGALKNTFGVDDSIILGLFGLRDAVQSVAGVARSAFGGLRDAVGGFVEGFGGMDAVVSAFSGLLPVLMGPLGILKDALLQVFGSGGVSVDMAGFGRTIGETVGPIVTLFAELSAMLTGVLAEAFAQILPVVIEVGGVLGSTLLDVLAQLYPVLGELAGALLPVIANLFATLVPVIAQVVTAVLPLVAMLIEQLAPVFLEIVSALLPPLALLLGAVASVVGTLVAALAPVITALVSQLAPILVTLVSALLPPLARVIAMVAEVISTVLAPILNVIINVLGVVFVGAINALMPVVSTVFGFIARSIGNAMDVISGIIRLVMAVIRGDWSGAWDAIKQILSAVWDQIKNVVTTAINLVLGVINAVMTTIRTIWNAIWEVIKAVGKAAWDWIVNTATGLFSTFSTSITTIFTAVRDFFGRIWDTIRDWVLERITAVVDRGRRAFDDFKTGVEDIFTRLRDQIGRIWDGIQEKVKAPIRFVVNTVLNEGLIDNVNKLLERFSVPTIPRVALPAGFYGGGATPAVGDRRIAGVVHGDEHVWTAREVRHVPGGHATMEAMRRAALAGKLSANLPGFFLGGHVPVPGGRVTNRHGLPYYNTGARWAGDLAMPTGTPIYAWKDGAVAWTRRQSTSYGNHLLLNHGTGESSLYAHASQLLVAAGQMVRAGQIIARVGSTGNSSGPHLHLEIRGGNSPLGGDTGSDGGFFADMLARIADTVTAPVRALIDRIPGDGLGVEIAKGAATSTLDKATEWVKSLIPASTDDGMAFVPGSSGTVPGLSGVTANTYAKAANIYAAATAAGHRISTVGGYRGDGEHVTRRALDFMVRNRAAGDFIANYVWSNRSRFGLQHVIWWQRIMSTARAGEGWRFMADRGNPTQNHMDHPHVLFNATDRGFWRGTDSAPPGWSWVGERGPELVRFRGGEQVLPAGESERFAGDAGATVNVFTVDERAAARRVVDELRWARGA